MVWVLGRHHTPVDSIEELTGSVPDVAQYTIAYAEFQQAVCGFSALTPQQAASELDRNNLDLKALSNEDLFAWCVQCGLDHHGLMAERLARLKCFLGKHLTSDEDSLLTQREIQEEILTQKEHDEGTEELGVKKRKRRAVASREKRQK